MKIALVLLLVFVVLLLGGMFWMAGFAMTGERQTLDEAFAWQSERYDTSFYDALEKTDFTFEGDGGYVLHAQELKNPKASDKFVIISHGYTDNRMGALKYVPLYLDLGYNCVIYDLRGHGLNEPTFTTYGELEGKDLAALVKELRVRHPELTQLGLQGESLGSATTITSLKYKPEVDFVVADCGFSDIENVLREGYRNAGAPQILFTIADLGARLRYGHALSDMRPIDSLDDNTIPILFIHGANDELIVPKNSQDMYERTKGPRKLQLVEGAGHAESVLVDAQAYEKLVSEFLAEQGLA